MHYIHTCVTQCISKRGYLCFGGEGRERGGDGILFWGCNCFWCSLCALYNLRACQVRVITVGDTGQSFVFVVTWRRSVLINSPCCWVYSSILGALTTVTEQENCLYRFQNNRILQIMFTGCYGQILIQSLYLLTATIVPTWYGEVFHWWGIIWW